MEKKFLISIPAYKKEAENILNLIKLAKDDNFITGSRFCKNGRSDYKGFRKLVSILGNFVPKTVFGINCTELTTYYRVYSTKILKSFNLIILMLMATV